MTTIAQPEATLQPVTPPTVKVKVSIRNERAMVTVDGNIPVGAPINICQHLPTRRMRERVEHLATNYGYNLSTCILNTVATITNEQWANAIASEMIIRAGHGHDASVELSTICDGGYLAIGNAVYRMFPVEIAPQSKAMRAIHHRTIEAARVESDRILKLANEQSASILTDAATKRLESERLFAEATRAGQVKPPRWAVDQSIPLRWLGGSELWAVGIVLVFKIQIFEYKFQTPRPSAGAEHPNTTTIKRWAALPHDYVRTLVWIPINDKGEFIQTHVRTDQNFYGLPHIKSSGACMALGSAAPITGPISLMHFKASLETAMAIVECNSLYVKPSNWHPNYIAALPPAIRSIMLADSFAQLGHPSVTTEQIPEVVDNAREANATWTR